MAGNTTNLGLYYKDPLTDGADTFNIKTMLNDNWNKIDEAHGQTNGRIDSLKTVLDNVGNIHVWEKSEKANPIVQSSSTAAVKLTSATTYTFGRNVEIENGDLVLKNTFTGKGNANSSVLEGCYLKKDGVVYRVYSFNTNTTSTTTWDMYEVSIDTSSYVSGNTVEYKTSTDPSAYPADGVQGDYYYTYIDQLGEPGAKIEVGSYVGTGTYGTLNRCSLTFSSTPKIVFIKNSDESKVMILFYGHTRGDSTGSTSSSGEPQTTWDGNTVTWYTDTSANVQFNSSGETYNYLAFY